MRYGIIKKTCKLFWSVSTFAHSIVFRYWQGPSILWNGMVVPLLNFPIKGAVWYQGEANAAVSLAAAELCELA